MKCPQGGQVSSFVCSLWQQLADGCTQCSQLQCAELQISRSMSCLLFGGDVIRRTGGSWYYCGGKRKGTQSTNPCR